MASGLKRERSALISPHRSRLNVDFPSRSIHVYSPVFRWSVSFACSILLRMNAISVKFGMGEAKTRFVQLTPISILVRCFTKAQCINNWSCCSFDQRSCEDRHQFHDRRNFLTYVMRVEKRKKTSVWMQHFLWKQPQTTEKDHFLIRDVNISEITFLAPSKIPICGW